MVLLAWGKTGYHYKRTKSLKLVQKPRHLQNGIPVISVSPFRAKLFIN